MTDTLATPALASYEPIPYRVDPDEVVTCPHCKLKDDTDATFCDQCGTRLAGRDDVSVGGEAPVQDYAPEPYDPEVDETVQCPNCQKMNDPDCRFCDQCGASLVGRTDVKTNGPVEDIDDVDRAGGKPGATRDADTSASDPEDGQCAVCGYVNSPDATTCAQCNVPISGAGDADSDAEDADDGDDGSSDPDSADEGTDDDSYNSARPTGPVRAKYSAADLKALGEKGQAFKNPDGSYSYPIADAEDLDAAIKAVGRGNADHDSIRKYIIGRAKALGLSDKIPDNWNADGSLKSANSVGAPKESLVRARFGQGLIELRETGDGAGTLMCGHFSAFNSWYEIDSMWEGTFMESVASSAFDRTMVEDRDSMRVLYDHGFDPVLGNKPLGPITDLRADDIGAYYEVPLLDTDYNRDFVLPALRGQLMSGESVGSQLGASFRFVVEDETWERSPEASAFNRRGLPQRTITRARVMEFGPVTFPASPTATAGVRSLTDAFMDHLQNDSLFMARFTERAGLKTVERILSAPRARSAAGATPDADEGRAAHSKRINQQRRKAHALLADV